MTFDSFPIEVYEEHRPWGKFSKFCQNTPATVKIIEINPGEQLSVQRHQERDEMWVALDPGLVALVGDDTIFMKDCEIGGEPVFIPRGTIHSVKNVNAAHEARFLEVAFGNFDENDIERLQDRYGRT